MLKNTPFANVWKKIKRVKTKKKQKRLHMKTRTRGHDRKVHFYKLICYWWREYKSNNLDFLNQSELSIKKTGKSILQVPDTGTWVLDNARPFLCSSIVSSWITAARSKERKYHIFRQYWYTKNVPVFTNTGTFQYLGPEVYFFRKT